MPRPRIASTRAITIRAPRTRVWAWLVQLGQGREGFYSFTRLENLFGLDIHNAERIDPRLQTLRVGDFIRQAPERFGQDAGWRVVRLEAPHTLVLLGGPPEAPVHSWALALDSLNNHTTRLVIRPRFAYPLTLTNVLLWRATEAAQFVMDRGLLLGLRRRAEVARSTPRAPEKSGRGTTLRETTHTGDGHRDAVSPETRCQECSRPS